MTNSANPTLTGTGTARLPSTGSARISPSTRRNGQKNAAIQAYHCCEVMLITCARARTASTVTRRPRLSRSCPGMAENRRRVKSTSRLSIHGPASTAAAKIASSLGMNDSVISLIWVAAWNTLTSRPVASAASSSGADSSTVTSRACCTRLMTISGVMALRARREARGMSARGARREVRGASNGAAASVCPSRLVPRASRLAPHV